MVQVIHEVIDTPFQVAMDCKHVPDNSEHVCWNCTIKIIDMAETAESRAAQLEAERDKAIAEFSVLKQYALEMQADLATARAAIVRYQDERVTLLDRLEALVAEMRAKS